MSLSPKIAIRALHYLMLIVLGIVIMYPVYFALSYSFMTEAQINSIPPPVFPSSLKLDNYIKVINVFPIVRFLFNSFFVSLIIMLGTLVTASLAAYTFAFLNFKGKHILFLLFMATMMVPWEVTIIPNFLTVQKFGWIDTYQGLSVPQMASAFGIFLLRQFFLQMPKELFEAAKIDGCGHMRIFLQLVLPLARPAIATLAVYTFLKSWNMYLWPLLTTNEKMMRTIQIGIAMLKNEEYSEWSVLLAGVVLSCLPTILILIFGLKQLISGITSGAVKQ